MGPYIFYNQLERGATSTLGTWPFSFLAGDYLLFFLSPEAGLGLLGQLAGYAVQRFLASLFSYGISSPNDISARVQYLKQLTLEVFGMKWKYTIQSWPSLPLSNSSHTHTSRGTFEEFLGSKQKQFDIVANSHMWSLNM